MLTVIDLGFLRFEEHNLYQKLLVEVPSLRFTYYYRLLIALGDIIQGLEDTK